MKHKECKLIFKNLQNITFTEQIEHIVYVAEPLEQGNIVSTNCTENCFFTNYACSGSVSCLISMFFLNECSISMIDQWYLFSISSYGFL
jgi:hypothetical protein